MKNVRVGIVGAGLVSDSHAQGYIRHDNAEIFAVCDLNRKIAESKAKIWNAKKVYTEFDEMLSDTEVNAVDFLTYARKAKFHKHVIEYIQSHPDRLYDFDAQKTGQVFANPASYEKLSTLLIKMENVNGGGLDGKVEDIETLAAGLLNVNMARMFVEFVVENKDISPQDILDDYAKVRAKIEAFKMSSDNATLTALMDAFTTYMIADMPVLSDPQRVNIATFLSDLPLDTAATFIMLVDQQDKDSKEFLYFTELHVKLMSNPDYKSKFFEAVVECGKGKQ